jgi:PIN domain nuclease of toxin-antitoxin system
VKLPPQPGGLFDRLLIVQAMSELVHLVTIDGQMSQYSKPVMRM